MELKKKNMAAVAGLYGLSDDNRQYRNRRFGGGEKQTPDGLSEP